MRLVRTTRWLVALAMVPIGLSQGAAAAGTTTGPDPQALAAWEKAGAKIGWLYRHPEALFGTYQRAKGRAAESDIPLAAVGNETDRQAVGRLPALGVPFVLSMDLPADLDLNEVAWRQDVHGIRTTSDGDRGLEQILAFKNVREITLFSINSRKRVGHGLKALGDLKDLKVLAFNHTQLSNEGLDAVADLEHLEMVMFNGTALDGPPAFGRWKSAPRLTTLILNDDYPRGHGIRLSPADMAGIGTFKELRRLKLGCLVADAGYHRLIPLQHVEVLRLPSGIGDHGFRAFKGFRKLKRLEAAFSNITDEGMTVLAGLGALQELDLRNADITDAGLSSLAGLSDLDRLNLSNTGITGGGLKYLSGLKALRVLELDAMPKWTDDGWDELAKLTRLKELSIREHGLRVNEAVAAKLARMTELRTLSIRPGTAVAPLVERLRKQLPDCQIQ